LLKRSQVYQILLIILFNFSAVRPIKNREANYDTACSIPFFFAVAKLFKLFELFLNKRMRMPSEKSDYSVVFNA